ncbi:MAG: putative O-glycosylation ligase, exosortase A system-associated [Candidatus Acidiferrum sp.]|jgi:putative inorganic carbon (HCO3(-)) transporter
MRDYLIIALILGCAPFCLISPYFGVLVSSWIAYFNPHQYAWGFATTFPVAQVIVIPTILGAFFAKDTNRKMFTRETVLLLCFWLWVSLTMLNTHFEPMFADHIQEGTARLVEFSKIMIMTLLTIYLVTSQKKLKYLLMVTSFSLGILALKGTIFGILTGGEFRVWGPPRSFIADNNDFGLALNMIIPMLFFLGRDEQNRKLKLLYRITFVCSVAAVLLTYSRGALLGLSAIMAVLALKSRYKLVSAFILVIAAFLVISFAPPAWMSRMGAFAGGKLDQSAEERLTSWAFAWNLAKHYPITGGGFECFTPDLFATFSPRDPETWLAGHTSSGPHSIYFQVLAEQGFVGLGMFLALLASCLLSARRLRKRAARIPALSWVDSYAQIVELGILGYMVSGAFLGRAYFDLYLQLVAILIVLKIVCKKEIRAAAQAARTPVVVLEPELQEALP